jgi:hypothetical protein
MGTDVSEQLAASIFKVEEIGGNAFLQNAGACLPDYTVGLVTFGFVFEMILV